MPLEARTTGAAQGWRAVSWRAPFILMAIGVPVAIFISVVSPQKAPATTEQRAAAVSASKADPLASKDRILEQVVVNEPRWQRSGMNNALILSGAVANLSPADIKDPVLWCVSTTSSGAVLGKTRRTLYEYLAAGSSKPLRDFNMGQIHSEAARVSCLVEDAVILR